MKEESGALSSNSMDRNKVTQRTLRSFWPHYANDVVPFKNYLLIMIIP